MLANSPNVWCHLEPYVLVTDCWMKTLLDKLVFSSCETVQSDAAELADDVPHWHMVNNKCVKE